MKRLSIFIFTAALLLGIACTLAGCKEQAKEIPSTSLLPTGVMVPVAQTASLNINISDVVAECLKENSFFYVTRNRNTDAAGNEVRTVSFCKRELEGFEEEKILLNQDNGASVCQVTLDAAANLYELFFTEEGSNRTYYLGKWNWEGKQLYTIPLTEVSPEVLDATAGCIANLNGQLCLYTWSGTVFLFDSDGKLASQWESGIPLAENGSFVTGIDEFYWYQDTGSELIFYRLDIKSSQLTEHSTWICDSSSTGLIQVFGSQGSLWIATGQGLYQYHIEENTQEEILCWMNPHINLDGSSLHLLSADSDGKLQLLFQRLDTVGFTLYERSVISWTDEGLLPQKEIVTLGTKLINGQTTADMEEAVRRFNRQSAKYSVELVHYFPRDEDGEIMDNVYMDILQNRAPDLINVSGLDVTSLAHKDFFEDLEPYLKDSRIIHKQDILENVWQEGQLEGKYRLVIPFFRVNTYVSHSPIPGQGWSFSEFTQYTAEHSDTPLVTYMSWNRALYIILFAGMNSFVDYERGECYFTAPAFTELLSGVKKMCLVQAGPTGDIIYMEELQALFENEKILLQDISFGSMDEFLLLQKQYGTASGWKGYPTEDGEPFHEMSSQWRLSINSASGNKDGAWAFLEFLLSEEIQDEYRLLDTFPVRKDSFAKYIETSRTEECSVTPHDILLLTETVNASHADSRGIDDDIFKIICEESGAYFAGDKSVEKTAALIQNRVQLYLAEKKN